MFLVTLNDEKLLKTIGVIVLVTESHTVIMA